MRFLGALALSLVANVALACSICGQNDEFKGRPDAWPSPGHYHHGNPSPNHPEVHSGTGTANGSSGAVGIGRSLNAAVGLGQGFADGVAQVMGSSVNIAVGTGSSTGQAAVNGNPIVGSPGCPLGVSGDGCTAGQVEATSGLTASGPPIANALTVQHPDFFTGYARQSGQTWGNTTGSGCSLTNCRPPWNVAGVDYPVGPQYVPTKDPAAPGTLPAGCTYCPANAPSGGGCFGGQLNQEVDCSGQASYDIEGFDFSNSTAAVTAGGQPCIDLDITYSNGGGTLTIKNNKFGYSAGCWTTDHNHPGVWAQADSGFATIIFSYNYLDGNGTDPTTQADFNTNVNLARGLTNIIEYNAFLDSSDAHFLVVSPGNNGTSTIMYNYLDGNPCESLAHCHFIDMALGLHTATDNGGYNTFLSSFGDLGGTAIFWNDPVDTLAVLTNWNRYNNVFISNRLGTSATYCGGACLWDGILIFQDGQITNANLTNNYFDSTGAEGRCLSGGTYGSAPIGTLTSGANTIASIHNDNPDNPMFAGALLYSASGFIPAGTTLSTYTMNTSGTMSQNATGTVTEVIHYQQNPLPVFTMSGNVNMLNGKSVNAIGQDLTTGIFDTLLAPGSPC